MCLEDCLMEVWIIHHLRNKQKSLVKRISKEFYCLELARFLSQQERILYL